MNEFINKHQNKIILVTMVLIFLSSMENFDGILWHWIDAIVTIGTVIGVWYNYMEDTKQKALETKKIPIYFYNKDTKEKYLLDLDIQVKYLTRGEIQGLLSAYQQKPAERYIIQHLSEVKFLDDIYKIQNNNLDTLTIELTNEELKGGYKYQGNSIHSGFNFSKMTKI